MGPPNAPITLFQPDLGRGTTCSGRVASNSEDKESTQNKHAKLERKLGPGDRSVEEVREMPPEWLTFQ